MVAAALFRAATLRTFGASKGGIPRLLRRSGVTLRRLPPTSTPPSPSNSACVPTQGGSQGRTSSLALLVGPGGDGAVARVLFVGANPTSLVGQKCWELSSHTYAIELLTILTP
jgi:hypothetical protein